MKKASRTRALVKLGFWSVATIAVFAFAIQAFVSGQMTRMYFHTAKVEGYAVNDETFAKATVDNPVVLTVEPVTKIAGNQAVPVKRGDTLPVNATGVIGADMVSAGRRVALDGSYLKVMIPSEVTVSNGVATKDTFRWKNVQTDPVSGVWNLLVVMTMGLCLGLLGESVTDTMGIKVAKTMGAH